MPRRVLLDGRTSGGIRVFNGRRAPSQKCTLFLMNFQYYIMPESTNPDFMFALSCEVLTFNGVGWIAPEDRSSSDVKCVPVPFTDESFAKAFSTLEKDDGCILISSKPKWDMICFTWSSEKERPKGRNSSKVTISNGRFKISPYLVKEAYKENKDFLRMAATMFA